jgi:hypothetical protein
MVFAHRIFASQRSRIFFDPFFSQVAFRMRAKDMAARMIPSHMGKNPGPGSWIFP